MSAVLGKPVVVSLDKPIQPVSDLSPPIPPPPPPPQPSPPGGNGAPGGGNQPVPAQSSNASLFKIESGVDNLPSINFISEFIPIFTDGAENEVSEALATKEAARMFTAKNAAKSLSSLPENIVKNTISNLSETLNSNRDSLSTLLNLMNSLLVSLNVVSYKSLTKYYTDNGTKISETKDVISIPKILESRGYDPNLISKFSQTKIWQQFLAELYRDIIGNTPFIFAKNSNRNTPVDKNPFEIDVIGVSPNPNGGSPRPLLWVTDFFTSLGDSLVKDKITNENEFQNNVDLIKSVTKDSYFADLSTVAASPKKIDNNFFNSYKGTGRDLAIMANSILGEISFSNKTLNNTNTNYSNINSSLGTQKKNNVWRYTVGNLDQKVLTDDIPKNNPDLSLKGLSHLALFDSTKNENYQIYTFEQKYPRLNGSPEELHATPGPYFFVDSCLSTTDGTSFDYSRAVILLALLLGVKKSCNYIQETCFKDSPSVMLNDLFSRLQLRTIDNYKKNVDFKTKFFNVTSLPKCNTVDSDVYRASGLVAKMFVSPTSPNTKLISENLKPATFLAILNKVMPDGNSNIPESKFKFFSSDTLKKAVSPEFQDFQKDLQVEINETDPKKTGIYQSASDSNAIMNEQKQNVKQVTIDGDPSKGLKSPYTSGQEAADAAKKDPDNIKKCEDYAFSQCYGRMSAAATAYTQALSAYPFGTPPEVVIMEQTNANVANVPLSGAEPYNADKYSQINNGDNGYDVRKMVWAAYSLSRSIFADLNINIDIEMIDPGEGSRNIDDVADEFFKNAYTCRYKVITTAFTKGFDKDSFVKYRLDHPTSALVVDGFPDYLFQDNGKVVSPTDFYNNKMKEITDAAYKNAYNEAAQKIKDANMAEYAKIESSYPTVDLNSGVWSEIVKVISETYNAPIYESIGDKEYTAYSYIEKTSFLYMVYDFLLKVVSAPIPEDIIDYFHIAYYALEKQEHEIIDWQGFLLNQNVDVKQYYNIDLDAEGNQIFECKAGAAVSVLQNEDFEKSKLFLVANGIVDNIGANLTSFVKYLSNSTDYLKSIFPIFNSDSNLNNEQRKALFSLSLSKEQIINTEYIISELLDRIDENITSESKMRSIPQFAEGSGFENDFSKYLPVNDIDSISCSMLVPFFNNESFYKKKAINKKIVSVGIPPKMVRGLLETSSSPDPSDQYRQNIIRIKIYKVDLINPKIVYNPQEYLFEMNRFPTRILGNWDYDTFLSDKNNLFEAPTKYFNSFTGKFDLHRNFSEAFQGYSGFLTDDQKFEIYSNHVKSFLAEEYVKWFIDVNIDESQFFHYEKLSKTLDNITSQYKNYVNAFGTPQAVATLGNPTALVQTFKDPLSGVVYSIPVKKNSQSGNKPPAKTSTKNMTIDLTNTLLEYFKSETFALGPDYFRRKTFYPKKFDRVFNVIIDPDDFTLYDWNGQPFPQGKYPFNDPQEISLLVSRGILKNEDGVIKHRDTTAEDITLDEYFVTIEPFYVKSYT